MEYKIIDLIDIKRIDSLLEGFNKTTGFVSAILDLKGNILSNSGWRKICTDFHRIHPETSKRCTESDTFLAGGLAQGEKYHYYHCLNGLVDVSVPIIIAGTHMGNLFSGQFFFEPPNREFFQKQALTYGFDQKSYLEALDNVPVVSKEQTKTVMDFLLNMTELISELGFHKLEQIQSKEELLDYKNNLEKLVKERTEQLIQVERLAALGSLSASVAHEMNNPLQGMRLHLEVLNDKFAKKLETYKSYQYVLDNIENIRIIVQQLLDVYKAKHIVDENVDLNVIIKNVCGLLENQLKIKKTHLEMHLNDNLPFIKVNSRQIHQVFLNLMLNALDSIESEGKITLSSEKMEKSIVIKVCDTGKGIEPMNIPKLFDPFFSTKGVIGVGLGLFVSQCIIKNWKGEISVESERGKGSTFTISLPGKAS